MELQHYVAFAGPRRIAEGPLSELLPILHKRFAKDSSDLALVFEIETGRQVEFDLRRPVQDVIDEEASSKARGPGRPRLGVVSREVSLLPRHWDWLEQQPNGISAALRRLVEQAIKTEPGKQRSQRIRAALSRVLSAVAGNRPNFEEACRALFAGDAKRFETLVAPWPRDLREYACRQANQAFQAEREQP